RKVTRTIGRRATSCPRTAANISSLNVVIEPGRATVAGRVLQEGKTVHVPDVLEDSDYAIPSLNA
ncbi:MAG: hypothetical protein WCD83_21290, partial [Pseudolabrys sp.]